MPTADFLAIAATEPPTAEEIEQRIVARIAAGDRQQLTAASVFDLNPGQIQALTREDNNLVLRYERESWAIFTGLGLEIKSRERGLTIINDALATSSSAAKVARLLNETVAGQRRYLTMISTDVPESVLWDHIPGGWIRLIVPVNGVTERLPFAGFRFAALPETAPVGWQELTDDDGHVLGWVQGSTIRLRFHPFLAANHRFTTARAEQRQAALNEILIRALPHLVGEARDDALPEFIEAWRQAIQTTEAVCLAIRTSTERLNADTTQLTNQHQHLEREVAQLAQRLAETQARLTEAAEELAAVPALEAAVAQRARLSISTIHRQLAEIANLPQVATVQLITRHFAYQTTGAAFAVTTHPLFVDCGGDGMRNVGPVLFILPISAVPDPILEIGAGRRVAHPNVTTYGTIEWGNSSVPLAQALGSDNYSAAARVLCSHLARPITNAPHARQFPSVTGTAGYQAE